MDDKTGDRNLTRTAGTVDLDARARRNGHRGGVLWLTGLSGSGKSALAHAIEARLFAAGWQAFVLDGDNFRYGLNADLGFSAEDRAENIRRAGEVAALMAEAGLVVLASFISPFAADRARARAAAGDAFHEIHISTPVEVCEARDPKGLYARARRGEIKEFTGIDSPYEVPEQPELVIDPVRDDLETCTDRLEEYAKRAFAVSPTA